MRSFFSKTELSVVRAPSTRIPNCSACGLYKTCKTPKMEPAGKGRKKILIVAEAPGEDADEQADPWAGNSGRELMSYLAKYDIDARRDCILDYSLRCRPPHNIIKNKRSIDYCRPNILNTIDENKPVVIILLGGVAVRSVLGHLWKEDPGGIGRWAGWQIPHQRMNTWICPTFHPSWLLREKSKVLYKRFDEHLEALSKIECRPWEKRPEWDKDVELIFSPQEAAERLETYTEGVAAFDFETNTLKPDAEWAKIYSCSVCYNGKETIAFPWTGAVIPAMKRFLTQKRLKYVGANIKFEDRWVREKLGIEIEKRWLYDMMNGAHVIWNAGKIRKITSVKFQAFAQYGLDAYDDHIRGYLKNGKRSAGNALNRIHLIPMKELLLYNAMDSFLEYKACMRQMKILKRGTI